MAKHKHNEAYLKAFGRRLKQVRLEKALSQEALAYDAGFHLSQIGRIERGEVNLGISTLKRIADQLGVHPSDLLKF